ncbi:ribosome biogenesis protein SLX9 homolog isoform X2 [Oncorhynchus nerka]|nr:protein FAM207A-like [Oncorhynchus nerka]
MNLNDGLFSQNGRCGYVLKPDFMRMSERRFDPEVPQNREGYQLSSLCFQVISAQQLPKVNIKESSVVDPFVRVEIHGLPLDQAKQETRYIDNNGFNPVWILRTLCGSPSMCLNWPWYALSWRTTTRRQGMILSDSIPCLSHVFSKKPLSSFPSGIFAGTQISPEALVQTLKCEELSNDTGTPAQKVPEEKKQQTKKEKMKERRDRWLNKISSIKLAKEQQVAQAKRAAMPVVGDMRPLADALPELCQLIPATTRTSRKASRKNRVPVKKKPEPTDFSLMKPAQKRKLLESETSRFSEAVKNLAHSKTNPLAAIGEHLRKRLKQEEEQGPS